MTQAHNAVSFGEKLDWLKNEFRVKDREIGAAVSVSSALVCRWRKGERTLVRVRDANVLNSLAVFFAECSSNNAAPPPSSTAAATSGSPAAAPPGTAAAPNLMLARVLELSDSEIIEKSEAYRNAFISFLFDGKPVADPTSQETGPPSAAARIRQDCFIGVEGLLDALASLENRMLGKAAEITVYLSLEHSQNVMEDSADKIWETLWRMGGGNPVRLVFDNWTDAGEAAKTLRGLLPYMQSGRVRFCLIKSTQKFFYGNISFYAAGFGIIITTEPVGGFGGSVSMLVESPDYLRGMSGVYTRLDKNIKNVEKHLNPDITKDEAVYYGQLFDSGSDMKSVIDGADLLCLDAIAYMELLKLNGVAGSQRSYRLDRFIKDKSRFEGFLESNRVTQVFSLPAFDRMISSRKIKTPDFSFFSGTVKANHEILKNLFSGMLDYLSRYENLSVYFNRRSLAHEDFSFRLKGDSFVLLHSCGARAPHVVWSDTWLLVYEYIRQFDEALRDSDLITTRDAVMAALRIRLENFTG